MNANDAPGTLRPSLPGPSLCRQGGHWLIADHGAQVLAWRPLAAGSRPVLWFCSSDPEELPGVIRGGAPICAPWFGHGPSDDQGPHHGLARLADFSGELLIDGPRYLLARYAAGPEALGAPLSIEHTVEMSGLSLTLSLRITNADSVPRRVEAVWHSYFRVGDAARARVEGVGGASWRNYATGASGTLADDVLPVAPDTDTVLAHPDGPLSLADPAWERRISVETEGCPTAIVWNPRMSSGTRPDLTGRGWRDLVCLETGAAKQDALELDPGQDTMLHMRVGVTDLNPRRSDQTRVH